jgi:predicted Zn-dependent protease
VWIIYAGLLLDTGDWEKLRSVALLIRQMPRFRRTLEGLSHYYEGRADLATGRTNAAANAFERASGAAFPDFNRAMATANGLRTNGYAQHALRVVDGLLAVHETNRIRVLAFKFELGMALQDESVVVAAARAAYEIAPHDAVQANRYAAAVLIEGKNPAEALRITRDLREQFPNSKSALLNHAYALLMNRRPDEAAALLNRLDPRLFSYAQVNSYYQSMFELNRQRGAHDAAWDAYDHINTTELFPIERARLKAAVETLPPRKPAAGS